MEPKVRWCCGWLTVVLAAWLVGGNGGTQGMDKAIAWLEKLDDGGGGVWW